MSIGVIPSQHHYEGYGLARPKASHGKIAPAMVAGFTCREPRRNQRAMEFRPALLLADLPLGEKTVVKLAGVAVLLINDEGEVRAVENRCSHMEAPLDCGRVRLGWIACPAHGARFDLVTGEALTGPASEPVRVFSVRLIDGMIEVKV